LFPFEAKITKLKRSEKLKAKKAKKSEKKLKNEKKREKSKKKWIKQKKEKIDLNFASLCFASKRNLLKWSEAKNLKQK
jgi:hypothetical protein